MKKIVITGATSFLGIHLIGEWLKESCEIYAVVRPGSSNLKHIPINSRINIIEKEMFEYDELKKDINSADYFYHLAWEGTRAPYRDDKDMQKKNYECTVKAFNSAVQMQCEFFLGAGSQAEYGIVEGLVDENYICLPNTEYGKEKLHAYSTLENLAKENNMRFVWTRIFSLYGKYDYSKTLVMSSIEKMKNNAPIDLSPCTHLWDFLNVEDAARALKLLAVTDCENGIYNVASGEYRPLREFVEEIKEVLESSSELRFGKIEYGSGGPVNLMPVADKIKCQTMWQPIISFKEGIKKMIDYKNFGGGQAAR